MSIIFKSKRLRVRKLKSSDIDAFYDMQSNPDVMKYIKNTMNRAESEKELKRFISYYLDDTVLFNIWAVEQKSDNAFVGICGVYKNDKAEHEIAYRFRQFYWCNGYGKEIAKALIQYCFEKTTLHELTAYVHQDNLGSLKIVKKEMEFVKELHCKKSNSPEKVYKINKPTWLSAKSI